MGPAVNIGYKNNVRLMGTRSTVMGRCFRCLFNGVFFGNGFNGNVGIGTMIKWVYVMSD